MAGDPTITAGPIKVTIKGERRSEKGLTDAQKAMKRELRKSHKATAKKAQQWIRAAAASGTPQQRRMRNAVRGESNSTQARISVRRGANKSRTGGALGAFYGAKKYRQFPAWVGNTWKPATAGEGPYVINATLAKHKDDIEREFLDGQMDAIRRATGKGV